MSKDKVTRFSKVSISGEIESMDKPEKNKQKRSLGLPSLYLDLGMYLAAPLIIAVFAGQYLDKRFDTGPLFTLSLILFGTITVFYNLYKLYSKDESTHKH